MTFSLGVAYYLWFKYFCVEYESYCRFTSYSLNESLAPAFLG